MKFTYGAELEWSDWDTSQKLPEGIEWNHQDYSIVNSNGVANDPQGKLWQYGGELNTKPTDTLEEQMEIIARATKSVLGATINYKSNLHLHLGVKGLRDDLDALKRIQKWFHDNYKQLLDSIDNFADLHTGDPVVERRLRRMEVSRHKVVSDKILAKQLAATATEEFYNWEAPQTKDGKPMFHIAPRLALNLRQLKDTNSVEFRHWASTMEIEEIWNAFKVCEKVLIAAMHEEPVEPIIEYARTLKLPKQLPVDTHLQLGYELTNMGHDRNTAPERIRRWLDEA